MCASMGLGGGSWHPHRDQGPLLKALYDYLESAAESMLAFIKAAWELQQHWVHQAWARTILGCALALGFVTAVVNAWGVPAINRKLPQVAQQASHALQRDVDIGKVHWVAPTGLTGLHPLVSMGPIAVGAGPVERSSAVLERVSLRVDPLQSLLRGRIVLALKASGAEVHLKQASNFSWFGYPDDTSPSARNFLPGIAGASEEKGQDPPGKGRRGGTGGVGTGGGTASGGTHNGAGSSAGHAQLAAAPRSEHGETTKSKAARVNGFLETIAQELLAWHAAQEEKATNALVAMHASSSKSEEPAVVLLNVGGPARVPRPQETMRIASQSQTAATDMERGEQSGSWFKLNPFASRKSPAPQGQEAEEQATGVERSKQSQLESLNTFEVSAKPRDGKGGAHPADTREPAASSADVASVEAVASAADPIASTVSAAPAAASSPEILEQQPTPAIDERITPVANLDTASSTAAQGDHEGQAAATSVMYTSEEESIDANRRMTLVERNPPANLIPSDRAAEFINALPGLQMSLVRGSAGEQGPSAEALPHPPPSAATRKINAMEATSAGAEIPVTMAVRSSSGVAEFMGTVIDPATIRKQGEMMMSCILEVNLCYAVLKGKTWRLHPCCTGLGSKALQKARNWQPAKPLVPRSSPESPSSNATHPLSLNDSEVHFSLEDGSEQAPATEDHARLSRSTSMSDSSQEATHARSPNSKLHVTHPGYFPTSTGPVYTPAPPEALARLRECLLACISVVFLLICVRKLRYLSSMEELAVKYFCVVLVQVLGSGQQAPFCVSSWVPLPAKSSAA